MFNSQASLAADAKSVKKSSLDGTSRGPGLGTLIAAMDVFKRQSYLYRHPNIDPTYLTGPPLPA